MNPSVQAAGTSAANIQRRSLLRQVLEGSVWNGLAIAASRLAPSFLTILLAWWLDPRELGSIAFVLAYYSVLSLFADWSIAYALQKLIPENVALTPGIAWTALCVRLGFSTVIAILCWTLDATTHAFRGYGMHLGLLLITSSFGIIVCVHNARCNFAVGSLLNVAFQIGWIGIALMLVKAGMRITGPLLALSISYAAIGIPAFLFGSFVRPGTKFLPDLARDMIRFGTWATLASVLAGISSQGGLLVLAYIAGDAPAGIYRVAMTFGMLPALLGMIVVTPLMPVVKRGLLDGADVTGSVILPIVRYLLMLGFPIAATLAAFAPTVIVAFVRESYSSAAWPMCFCVLANIFVMLMTAFSGILFVGDGLKDLAKIQGVVAVVTVCGSAALARAVGANGPAIASVGAWSVGVVLLYRWFVSRTPIPLEWWGYLRYGSSACVSAAVAALATKSISSALTRCSVGACSACILYVLFLWIQRDLGFLQLIRALRQYLPERTAATT
jgi:O-antigen/teichoic acid export membrane protein